MRRRNVLFTALTVGFVWGLIELSAAIFALAQHDFVFDHASYYSAKSPEYLEQATPWFRPRVSHPYFGFVFDPQSSGINNLGFLDPHDYPYRAKKDEVVVGVFGGSVAMAFAADREATERVAAGLKASRAGWQNKQIVFLNFGIAGGKQPQQYFVFSYFLDTIQFAINIEGFNEVQWDPSPEYPVDYPINSNYFLRRNSKYLAQLYRVENARSLANRLAQMGSESGLLRFSQAYYLFTKSITKIKENWESQLAERIFLDEGQISATSTTSPSEDQKLKARIAAWEKYTERQNKLAEAYKIPTLVIIQPNRHVALSKVLSAEEKYSHREGFTSVTKGYQWLDDAANLVRAKGVPVYMATDIFKFHPETLYTDGCCHFNSIGNRLLADFIVAKLSQGADKSGKR